MPMEGNLTANGSTQVRDYSSYANNGTVTGATWNATAGYDGWGAYNTSAGYVQADDSDEFDLVEGFSIETWVRTGSLPTAGDWNGIVTKGATGETSADNHNYLLGYCTGGLGGTGFCFTIENSAGQNCDVAVGSSAQTDTWYHLVAVFDNTYDDMVLYVDGVPAASTTCTYDPNTNAHPVLIGDFPVAPSNIC